MIGFEINKAFLEVNPDTSMQVVIKNPLFNEEAETGLFTYDFTLKPSRVNNRLTGYAGMINRQPGTLQSINCNLWLANQHYRAGKLNVLEAGKEMRFTYQSEAGTMAAAKDEMLHELDLGADNLSLAVKDLYPLSNYALAPVKNAGFYGDANTAFKGYLNYYQNGNFRSNTSANEYAIVPFPYLVYILKKVFAHYGFTISGDWINSTEAKRLIIYNTYALDKLSAGGLNQFESGIDFRNHVPKVKVSDFLKDMRILLGLSFYYNTNAREVAIVKRNDVLAAAEYADWTRLVIPGHNWYPNERNGFILEQKEDSGDAEQKFIADKLRHQVGKGKDTISTGCSYPDCRIVTDQVHGFRDWLVPVVDQEGNSAEFGLGSDNDFSFRLLSYYGLQPDSDGNSYPMASFGEKDITGLNIGTQSLAWQGPKGLYETAHKEWVNFLGETEKIILPVRLGISQLSLLDPRKKVLIQTAKGTVKAFWEKIEFDVHAQKGIRTAKATFYKTRN